MHTVAMRIAKPATFFAAYAAAYAGLLSLAGCAGSLPTSPDAYRQAAASNPLYSSASFSVARPMSAVTASLSAAAQICLNKTMSSTGQYRATAYGGNSFSVTRRFTASVTNSPAGATLAVKAKTLHTTGFGHKLSGEPEDGYEPTSRITCRSPQANGSRPFATGPQVRHPAQI
jgi:hypothetical protein